MEVVRSAMKFIGIVLVVTALAVSATGWLTSAKSFDELMRLAGQDTLPEVRQAAALALTPQLVTSTMSNDDLHQLAQSDPSTELRTAAARALGERLVQAVSSLNSLEALATSGEFPQVRQLAGEALSQRLLQSGLSLDELTQLATQGASPELRSAAVPALTQALAISDRSLKDLLTAANSGTTAEYRLAVAQALVLRLSGSPLFTLDQSVLLDIVGGKAVQLPEQAQGANAQLRAATAAIFREQLSQANWSLDALEQLAGNAKAAPELRAAAGAILANQLLQTNLTLGDLEKIATGSTPELRAAAHETLVQALVGAVGENSISLQDLVGSVANAASEELAEAETEAVFVLLRTALVDPSAQSDVEAVANGKSVQVEGVTLDGTLRAFRIAASNFLTGIYTFFDFLNRLSDPLKELTAIAGDPTLTSEFRIAAAEALVPVYQAQRGRSTQDLATLSALLDQISQAASRGQLSQASDALTKFKQLLNAERSLIIVTAEVGGQFTVDQMLNSDINRYLTQIEQALKNGELITLNSVITSIKGNFNTISRGIAKAPDVSTADLEKIAAQGETEELRQAASQALAQRFLQDPPAQSSLQQLAQQGASAELREASVPALTAAYITDGFDPSRLYQEALQGATDEARLAAARAFIQLISTNLSSNQLQSLADGGTVEIGQLRIDGSGIELREAFAQALQKALGAGNLDTDLLSLAVRGATPELRRAAAEAWAARSDGALKLTIDELIALAVSGQSPELRQAAAEALVQSLVTSKLTESDIMELTSMHTRAFGPIANTSEELSWALSQALANRLAHES